MYEKIKKILMILFVSGCVDIWIIIMIKIYNKILIWLKNHTSKNKGDTNADH